jgi:hypothetical protein
VMGSLTEKAVAPLAFQDEPGFRLNDGRIVPKIEEWVRLQTGKPVSPTCDAVLVTPVCRTNIYETLVNHHLLYTTVLLS